MRLSALLVFLFVIVILLSECDAARKRRRHRKQRRKGQQRSWLHPKDCGPIPHIDHGQALQTPDEIHYDCEPGYRLEGTDAITCINGRWTVAPRCLKQICPTPPLIAFANPPQLSASGTAVTYNCLSGYRIVNGNGATSKMLNCNAVLRQWPGLPQCEPTIYMGCGAPPHVFQATSSVSGNTVTYTCLPGYTRRPGTPNVINCNGVQWSFRVLPACDRSTFPALSKCVRAPPCGGSTISRGEVADSYDANSTVKYTCITGYRLAAQNDNSKNNIDIRCNSDGTWDTVPTCEPAVCGQPTHAFEGNTQVTAAATMTFGSQYNYQCLSTYHTNMATMATCNADGQWSIPPPTCSPKVCKYSDLPTLTNGSPYMVTENADIPVGSTTLYQCNSGYRIAPSSQTVMGVLQSITCQESGTFTAFTYTCVYNLPSTCVDYFRRDNLFATAAIGTPIAVIIDMDGAGSAVEIPVTCTKISSTTVRTQIVSQSGTSLTGADDSCTTTTTPILPDVTFIPGGGFASESTGICDSATVNYGVTAAQITAVLSSSRNCRQQISITCANLALEQDANFLAVIRNGDSDGVTYSATSAYIGGHLTTLSVLTQQNLLSLPCDCHLTNQCSGCTCSTSSALISGQDTITLYLDGDSPRYVTSYARVGGAITLGAPNAADPTLGQGEFDVTVGNIECTDAF